MSPEIPAEVKRILKVLRSAGREAWCVGGCVRDLLLGRTPQDWDVATSALPEEVQTLFAPRTVPTGLRHGTVTVLTEGGGVEVTTYRLDGPYQDCRHPEEVTFTRSLTEDLQRRDFTINAMAMDGEGNLSDPFGGREDLQLELLRCVGDPDRRLTEDALRILRCLRFSAQLSFAIDTDTEAALRRHKDLLRQIAMERVREELTKLLLGPAADQVLLEYADVVGVVLPEILPAVGFDQRNRHHCFDVWEHSVRAVAAAKKDPIVRWTLLLHDLGKPETFTVDEAGVGHFYDHGRRSETIAREICERLRMDRDSREAICRLVRLHDAPITMTEKGIRRMLRKLGEEDFRRLLQVKRGDNLAQHPAYLDRQKWIDQVEEMLEVVLREDQCFSLRQLAVKGNDLLALGLHGKAVGDMLDLLLDQVVEGKVSNHRELLLELAAEEIQKEDKP